MSDADLELLHKEFKSGDTFALHEAFIYCARSRWNKPLEPWVRHGLVEKLIDEMQDAEQGRMRIAHRQREQARPLRQVNRYEVFNWYRLQGYGWEESLEMTAEVFNVSAESIRQALIAQKKDRGLPEGTVQAEDFTPSDLTLGPDERTLHGVMEHRNGGRSYHRSYHWFRDQGCTKKDSAKFADRAAREGFRTVLRLKKQPKKRPSF